MVMTWAALEIEAIRSAMRAATSPLTPASISSKISVGTSKWAVSAAFRESMTLLRSPPEATLVSGCNGWPGLAAKDMLTR